MAASTTPKKEDYKILGILIGSFSALLLFLGVLQYLLFNSENFEDKDEYWLLSLLLNLLGYSTILIPGYLVIRFVKQTSYVENSQLNQCVMEPLIRLFVYGSEKTIDEEIEQENVAKNNNLGKQSDSGSKYKDVATLLMCFFGLQASYLTWGLLQEKIMTKSYENSSGDSAQFKDSQFLVFVNRILAFAIALLYITVTRQPRHRAPLYKYSYCSLSNIMSSWFQYEVLKYVSFPTQVLAKASKIIPVMIMGKIVSNKKYQFYEYIVAVMISMGMALFLFGSQDDRKGTTLSTRFAGFLLLIGYMACDSFTSNWQNELFEQHQMSSVQMMCGVNLFSVLLTSTSLLQQGGFYSSLLFMSKFPTFAFDCIILSICSALGQLFIYYTISKFGAVVFIIIMTLRQAMAILLSCVIYKHSIALSGVFGILVVFGAMFLKIYCGQKLKAKNNMVKIKPIDQNQEKA